MTQRKSMSCAIGPAEEPTIALEMLAIGARLERGDCRKGLALEELEEGAAGGRDVVDIVGDAELVDRRHRIAAARDRVRLRFCDRARERLCTFGERFILEYTDRPIPDDRAGLLERSRERFCRLGP